MLVDNTKIPIIWISKPFKGNKTRLKAKLGVTSRHAEDREQAGHPAVNKLRKLLKNPTFDLCVFILKKTKDKFIPNNKANIKLNVKLK